VKPLGNKQIPVIYGMGIVLLALIHASGWLNQS
jgi:hypothetical protein